MPAGPGPIGLVAFTSVKLVGYTIAGPRFRENTRTSPFIGFYGLFASRANGGMVVDDLALSRASLPRSVASEASVCVGERVVIRPRLAGNAQPVRNPWRDVDLLKLAGAGAGGP